MTPFPHSGKIKVTPEQSKIVQNRLTQLGFKHRSSAGFRENNSKVCIYWRSNLFDTRGDGYIGQFAGDSRTKYTMSLFESEGEDEVWEELKGICIMYAGGIDDGTRLLDYLKSRYKITRI